MCDSCIEKDYEKDSWEAVACNCACAEEDLNPLEEGDSICDECKHRVKG
jgi:hypothetical protein